MGLRQIKVNASRELRSEINGFISAVIAANYQDYKLADSTAKRNLIIERRDEEENQQIYFKNIRGFYALEGL